MASGPAVSVIIPCYNRAGLIAETLNNMLEQTLAPHEVIVVDDGSTDNSVEVVKSFGDRVRLIQQENAGPGAARNAGLAVATGQYIQFFDSDDLCSPRKLELQAGALEATGADIAYGPWAQVYLQDGKALFDGFVHQQRAITRSPLSAYLNSWLTFIPCCVIRRTMIDAAGGYPTARRTGEDMELLFRLIIGGVRLVHVPDAMVLVRQHPDQQISASPSGEAMRAADRHHLTTTVWDLLETANAKAGLLDRVLWRGQMWSAEQGLRRLDDGGRQAPGIAMPWPLVARLRQISAGLRARAGRSRLIAQYQSGGMTFGQKADIRRLGYEPTIRARGDSL